MSPAKIVMLVIYAVLLALSFAVDGAVGTWSLRVLVLLAVVHAIEVLVFFKVCRDAPGGLPGHMLSVFLFGILHVNEIKAARGN